MQEHTILQKDFYRQFGRWEKSVFLKGYLYPGFRFIYYFRKAQQYPLKHPFGLFCRLMMRRYSIKYGFQISARNKIGEGFYIGHWGTIVINTEAVIGKNCNIAHGVTIGQTNRGKKEGVPTIGDEVWIGANAVIVGGVTIGDNVLIAPLSYVNMDIPSNSIVMGNPATIIPKETATEGYIQNKI